MLRTRFRIPKMDCPSEEQVIRTAFAGVDGIRALEFDLPGRGLAVTHEGDAAAVLAKLEPLGFGVELVTSTEVNETPAADAGSSAGEARVLRAVLAINATMFVVEAGFGLRAESTGLIADSLDMFADAAVYAIALYATGRAAALKVRVAHISGGLQMLLALGAFGEIVRRMIIGAAPEPKAIVSVALLALAANVASLVLLFRHRGGGAHMRASYIFTTTDVLANVGVIVAGGAVAAVGAAWPDWIAGGVIAAMVLVGAVRILRLR